MSLDVDFIAQDQILTVELDGREVPMDKDENGVLTPNPNLYSFANEDGVLSAVDRIAPKPTSPLGILWVGVCTIYEHQTVTDPDTYQTTFDEVAIVVNEPCRVSYTKAVPTSMGEGVATVTQVPTLFIRPDLTINEGCVIEITQNNRTTKYRRSSKPSVYSDHQEVVLELYEDKV